MESGATWDDPTEDALYELLLHIERGDEEFIVIERTSDPSGQTYAQSIHCDDRSWLVERRDGSADRHFRASSADIRSTHQVLTAWAFELDGWRGAAAWEPVTV